MKNAVEMADCLVQYPDHGSLCVAIGNNPWAGGWHLRRGHLPQRALEAHRIGDEFLDGAHRLRVTVSLRGQTWRWVALRVPARHPWRGRVRGRFTGYVEQPGRDYTGARPVKEFRGWVWQDGQSRDFAPGSGGRLLRPSFFSLRLPVEALREALFARENPPGLLQTWTSSKSISSCSPATALPSR